MNARTRTALIVLLALLFLVPGLGGAVKAEVSQQTQFAVPIFVANTSFLNVRTGPGIQYTVLVTVVGGTQLPVLGVAGDRTWYLVSTPVGNGWVNVQYVLARGDFTNVPLLDVNAVSAPLIIPSGPLTIGLPAGQGGGAATTATTVGVAPNAAISAPAVERFRATLLVPSVNARTEPREDAPTIATLLQDYALDYRLVGSARDRRGIEWFAVVVPDVGTGWVEAPKIRARLSARYRPVAVVIAQEVAVTSSPGGDRGTLPVLGNGQEAFIIGLSQNGQHVQLELPDGRIGWVPFSSVVQREGTLTDEIGPEDPAYAELAERERQAAAAAAVAVPAGQGGGAVTGPQLAIPRAIVNTGFLNVRSGPGVQFTEVATLPGGTELQVIAIASDEVWYLVQGSFGRGWINEEFVIFRGYLANLPIIPYDTAVAAAAVSTPIAVVNVVASLYAAPGTNFAIIGTVGVNGPVELPVVARTADFNWVQLNTAVGFGWVPASQVFIRGDVSLVPVVG